MTTVQVAAKVLIRVGVALVILSVMCRLVGLSGADLAVDTMAIVASLLVVATGVIADRVSARAQRTAEVRAAVGDD